MHAGVIVNVLADPDEHMRRGAMVTLYKMEQAALTLHAGAIVNVVANAELRVGCPARLCWSFSPSTGWRARCTPVASRTCSQSRHSRSARREASEYPTRDSSTRSRVAARRSRTSTMRDTLCSGACDAGTRTISAYSSSEHMPVSRAKLGAGSRSRIHRVTSRGGLSIREKHSSRARRRKQFITCVKINVFTCTPSGKKINSVILRR